jgi:hypothetical protein
MTELANGSDDGLVLRCTAGIKVQPAFEVAFLQRFERAGS